jgi:hypothetical protein
MGLVGGFSCFDFDFSYIAVVHGLINGGNMPPYLGMFIGLGLFLMAIVVFIVIRHRNKRKKSVLSQAALAEINGCKSTGFVKRHKQVNLRKRTKVTSKQGVSMIVEESCVDVLEVFQPISGVMLPNETEVNGIIAMDQNIKGNNINVRTEDVGCLMSPVRDGVVSLVVKGGDCEAALELARQNDQIDREVVVNRIYRRRA